MSPPGNPPPPGSDRSGVLGRLRGRGAATAAAPPPPPDTDPVTGLPDRSLLASVAKAAIDRSLVTSSRAAVVFVGLDLLRDVNDSFGPDAGDFVLASVADRLRSIDVPGTKVLRHAGAEFALVFEQVAGTDMCEEIASFVIELLSPPYDVGHDRVGVAASVGVAISSDKYDTLDELLRDAHEALVKARERGHGTWHVHDETRRGRYSTRVDETRLHDALDNGEFFLQYQPIVRPATLELVGVEALLRWRAPQATNIGLLHPHDFMPMLEKSGLAVAVGRWALSEASRQMTEWLAAAPDHDDFFVMCNVGPRQLASTEFHDTVLSALAEHGTAPGRICVEITEEALRHNRNASWSALRDLKSSGVKVSLDDFGTGVSSLTYLRQLNLDLLHLDRTFQSNIEHSAEDRAIVANVARLCHDLDIRVIAQGVEDAEQADRLAGLGVDLAQGFHYGRPEGPDRVLDRLRPDGGSPPASASGAFDADGLLDDLLAADGPAPDTP